MSLSNLPWFGWVLLALSATLFLNTTVAAARFVRHKHEEGNETFFWPVVGLTVVLYLLVSP